MRKEPSIKWELWVIGVKKRIKTVRSGTVFFMKLYNILMFLFCLVTTVLYSSGISNENPFNHITLDWRTVKPEKKDFIFTGISYQNNRNHFMKILKMVKILFRSGQWIWERRWINQETLGNTSTGYWGRDYWDMVSSTRWFCSW